MGADSNQMHHYSLSCKDLFYYLVLRVVDSISWACNVPMCWGKQTNSILVLQTVKPCLAFRTKITKVATVELIEKFRCLFVLEADVERSSACRIHFLWVLGNCTAGTPTCLPVSRSCRPSPLSVVDASLSSSGGCCPHIQQLPKKADA